jgi:hypothetical protein
LFVEVSVGLAVLVSSEGVIGQVKPVHGDGVALLQPNPTDIMANDVRSQQVLLKATICCFVISIRSRILGALGQAFLGTARHTAVFEATKLRSLMRW